MKVFLLNLWSNLAHKMDHILGFMAIFLLAQKSAFIAVGCLVFIDLFTGVWSSYKFKEKITSKRLKDTVTKLVLYNLLIITCMITEHYLLTRIPFIEVSLGIIATVETTSIFENMEKILGISIIKKFKEALSRKNPEKTPENE